MVTRPRRPAPSPKKSRLRVLIEEATVDAYDDAEQLMGLAVMIEEHLDVPFAIAVLGTPANVVAVVENDGGELGAVCQRGKASARLSLIDMPTPKPAPDGWEWVEAYREWARTRR